MSKQKTNEITFAVQVLEPRIFLSAGLLDTNFGTGGIKSIPDLPTVLVAGSGGQSYGAGVMTVDGKAGLFVRHYNADGSVDGSFAPKQGYDGASGYTFIPVPANTEPTVFSLDRASDGDLLLGANEFLMGSYEVEQGLLVQVRPNGVLDTGFANNGLDMISSTSADNGSGLIAVSYDLENRILYESSSNSLERLTPGGVADSAFDANAASDFGTIALRQNGQILLTYNQAEAGGLGVMCINSNGMTDTNFGENGIAFMPITVSYNTSFETTVELALRNGNIAVAGYPFVSFHGFNIYEGPSIVAEFLPDGKPDLDFGDDGFVQTVVDPSVPQYPSAVSNYSIDLLVEQPNGDIILGGGYLSPTALQETYESVLPIDVSQCYLVRTTADGKIDTTFGKDGNLLIGPDPIYSDACAFALLSTGDIELAATYNGQPSLIRYTAYTPVSPTVTGTVYSDAVGAGQFIANQTGVANQTVYADLNDNGKLDPGEPKTLTDSHGNYTLSNLPTGPLIIRQVLQTGQRQSAPSAGGGDHVVAAANAVVTANFETTTKAYLSGTIFNDKNANGKLDPGEPGLPGWTVYVDLNHDGKLDAGDISTLTNSAGGYSFYQLSAGTYTLCVAPPPPSGQWKSVTSNSSSLVVKLQAGQVATNYNFGFTPIAMPMADNDLISLRAIF